MPKSFLRLVAVTLLLAWSSGHLHADSIEWTNPVVGDFDDATKWTVTSGAGAPPPAAGDSIFLNEAGAYTIKLTSDEAADFLRATLGTVSLVGDSVATRTLDLTTGAGDLSVRGAGTLNLGGVGTPLVVNVGDRFEVAHGSGGGDGTVNVSGTGSELNVLGVTSHNIGISGNTGRVNVTDDALLSFVDGSTLVLGRSSSSASSGRLEVLDGGDLTAANIAISTIDSGATGFLTVRGAGTTVTQLGASTLGVGNEFLPGSASGMIQVLDNAVFSTGTGAIDLNGSSFVTVATADINTNTFHGGGGVFNANGPVTMAAGATIGIVSGTMNVAAGLDNSDGGEINLGDGALLNITGGVFVPSDPNQDAPEFVVGDDAPFFADGPSELRVGGSGTADVSTLLTIGSTQQGTVTVTGGGVLNNNPGGLGFSAITRVGQSDTGTLRIEAGGTVNSNDDAVIGGGSTGNGTVEVDGVGSVWKVADRLTVGDAGTGALRIENGGVVNSGTAGVQSALVGSPSGSDGSVVVDGAGSEWNHAGPINLGTDGGQGTVEILDGGRVTAGSMLVNSGATDGLRVAGSGSRLDADVLGIGNLGLGGMTISAGGQVNAIDSGLNGQADATVTGAGAVWNAGELFIAFFGNAAARVRWRRFGPGDHPGPGRCRAPMSLHRTDDRCGGAPSARSGRRGCRHSRAKSRPSGRLAHDAGDPGDRWARWSL